MSDDTKKIKEENIGIVLKVLSLVSTALTRKHALALHLYIHAVMHKTDPTAIAAGLEAARYADKEKLTLTAPVDCILATLVSEFGFETVTGWNDEELTKGLRNMDVDKATAAAERFILSDMERFNTKKQVDKNIEQLMGQLPPDTTQH